MSKESHPVIIKPLNMQYMSVKIVGTAPYVQARFSEKARQQMMSKMAAGTQSRSKKVREARDFDEDMRQATHFSTDGWAGIPASAIRNACISACRLVGFKMTIAKLSIFAKEDGFDAIDGIPLIKIEGTPERLDMHTRNQTGVCDIRVRPMWRDWSATLRLKWDADQFSASDMVNLIIRAGDQVGIGEGRPDSRESAGLGYGTFMVQA